MNKQKAILKILFFISFTFLYPQEKDFEKSISETEQQIQALKNAINKNNNEINTLKTKAQQTNKILTFYLMLQQTLCHFFLTILSMISKINLPDEIILLLECK